MRNLGNFNPEKKKDVQLDLPFENESKNKITHLNLPEDFSNLEGESPVEHEALIEQIETLEEQNRIDAMEKASLAEEEASTIQQKQIEINKLIDNDRDDKPGEFDKYRRIENELRYKKKDIKKRSKTPQEKLIAKNNAIARAIAKKRAKEGKIGYIDPLDPEL